MGRRNTIDRGHVLEVAEQIVHEQGAGALTIDAVAKAAGITKGGVQSCFGTKEGLVEAMLARWMDRHDAEVASKAPEDPSFLDLLRLHIKMTGSDDVDSQRRVAGLLSVLLQSPAHLERVRGWYADRTQFGSKKNAGSDAELAFLATEGAFFLRYLGLVDYSDQQWRRIFGRIEALLEQGS